MQSRKLIKNYRKNIKPNLGKTFLLTFLSIAILLNYPATKSGIIY